MDIKTYLETTGTTQEEFGKKLGVSRSAVNQWISGKTVPRARVAADIVRLTRGRVRISDLYPSQQEAA